MYGERSPIWDTNARGVFFGLSLATQKRDLVRAIMEGAVYGLRHNVEVAAADGFVVEQLACVGGGARSALWNQIKADVLQRPLHLPRAGVGAANGRRHRGGGGRGSLSVHRGSRGAHGGAGSGAMHPSRPTRPAMTHSTVSTWDSIPRCAPISGNWARRAVTDLFGQADLAGRVVLVTGGSRGIGRAVVLAFAALGCRVAFCYRTDHAAAAAVEEVQRPTAGRSRAFRPT